MITPDFKSAQSLSKTYVHIPLYEKAALETLNVEMIYEHFRGPYTCLFELEDQGTQARYAIIGLQAKRIKRV